MFNDYISRVNKAFGQYEYAMIKLSTNLYNLSAVIDIMGHDFGELEIDLKDLGENLDKVNDSWQELKKKINPRLSGN